MTDPTRTATPVTPRCAPHHKRAPSNPDRAESAGSAREAGPTGWPGVPDCLPGEHATGSTAGEPTGPPAMPKAPETGPEKAPITAPNANKNREVDSGKTSPPYRAKRW